MTRETGDSVRGRTPYLPIHKRPKLSLPGNARVAVWTIVNVENWSPAGAMPRTVLPPPMGQPLLPDVPNWAWHEYGMRVGFWRFLETLSARKLKATFAVNGTACELYPRGLPGRARGRLGLHGPWLRAEADAPGRRPEDRHRRHDRGHQGLHRQAAARLGKPGPHRDRRDARPAGRGRHRICRRLGDRRAAGPAQDQRTATIVSVPYTVEINDVVISAVQQQPSDEIFRRGRDQFDRLYLDGARPRRA